MKFFILFCFITWFGQSLYAATVLHVEHNGSANPITQGFSAGSPSTTNIQLGPITVGGVEAWRIMDPGIAPGGKSNSNNYSKTFDDNALLALMTHGWSMKATVSVPVADPTTNTAWAVGSQMWVGGYYKHAASPDLGSIAASTQRMAWGLMLGRNASNQTVVGLHGYSAAQTTLAPGFHDYELIYNPVTKKANVYIDGAFWTEYAGAVSTTGTSNMFYWGDNNNQSVATNNPMAAYYSHVSYTIAPEPSMAVLSLAGFASLLLRRKRVGSSI